MEDIKADAVLFLTRDGAVDWDRDAARLLGKCEVETRHAAAEGSNGPSLDVLVHAKPQVISQIKSCDVAGRVENALRNAARAPVRYLQWVEEGVSTGPRNESAIGDGSGSHARTGGAIPDERPQLHRDPARARVPNGNEPRG